MTTEAELDASTARLAARLAASKNEPQRVQLFAMLRDELHAGNGRGARLVTPSGEVLAWWGEELRVSGMAAYQFDVTNVYILRSRNINAPRPLLIEMFQRIINRVPHEHSLFDEDDDWINGYVYHAGALRQRPEAKRFLLEQRPDATLYVDIVPRTSFFLRQLVKDIIAAFAGRVIAKP